MEARNGEEEEDEAFHRRSGWRWMPNPELLLTPAHLDSKGERMIRGVQCEEYNAVEVGFVRGQ